MDYRKQQLRFRCCSGIINLKIKKKVQLNVWISSCIAINFSNRTYKLWFNKEYTSSSFEYEENIPSKAKIRSNGAFVIGQDQDMWMGGFNKLQSVFGSLADFRIYDDVLTSSAMKKYTHCDSPPSEKLDGKLPVIDFEDFETDFLLKNVIPGETKITHAICYEKPSYDIIFPEFRTFYETSKFCSNMAGEMKVPLSKTENDNLFQLSAKNIGQCSTHATDFLWLGIIHRHSSKQFVDSATGRALSYRNIKDAKINYADSHDTCVSFNGSPMDAPVWQSTWVTRLCNDSRCSVCHFPQPSLMTLRGLCEKTLLDSRYFVFREKNVTLFYGEYYSAIHFEPSDAPNDTTLGQWILHRYDEPDVKAVLTRERDYQYPLGLNDWTLSGDLCESGPLQLKLSTCTTEEFTCNHGSCISKDQRCDTKLDCDDGEDEDDCHLVDFPPKYSHLIAPPASKENRRTIPVAVHIEIFSIKSIELSEFEFSSELTASLQWKDNRVKFHNLKTRSYLNSVLNLTGSHSLWRPDSVFEGAENTTCDVTLRSLEFYAIKKTPPLEQFFQTVTEGKKQTLQSENWK